MNNQKQTPENVIDRRYNLIIDFEENHEHSTQTLEDYNTLDEAKAALEFIRVNSFHLPEHYDCIETDKITFPTKTDFTIDCSVYQNGQHLKFESVPHNTFSLKTK